MIDKENEIYTLVRNAVKAADSSVSCDSSYQTNPATFPHLSFWQSEFATPIQFLDSSELPKFQRMTYEAQVYCNAKKGKKEQAKAIMSVVVDTMQKINFRLVTMTIVPNLADSSIYRMAARFEAIADEGGIYRS